VEEVRGVAPGCAEDLDPGEEVPLRGVGDAVEVGLRLSAREVERDVGSEVERRLRLAVREQIRPGSPLVPGVGELDLERGVGAAEEIELALARRRLEP